MADEAVSMRNVTADIIATVTLFDAAHGGRGGPTPPNELRCMMSIENIMVDVRLYLNQIGPLHPGQTADVPIRFLFPEHVRGMIAVKKKFTLHEAQPIGSGVIKEIIKSD